ncbi:3-oxoacyl-[acyl-carrier-protein] reductase [Wickerhamomyces ciferrii]|uniref:3-oxoacyl-[acyl-carrier-protein] reductase n=1 Tax=Wickerhamomyces ciferrii (strain ATCC 14091 / BCRC 22168 / CBS 111 / JCM 3599 / NBRC 0793 / NRRL Y-1031 F-60-10) TaxID=1206466 RepID=K0KTZ7_WICCF|nr:3-oxoacyl-[acyl-carrier-protein] reductase [Wickerhamomyces ciferrii]CCH45497.1 3-oxoacyl-[acyl-carrier-protein] reductase [Wickerhamomyces ciferrii]
MGLVYFITGANRGIGLEFVRQLASADSSNKVIATVREPSKAKDLEELKHKNPNIHIIKLDVSTQESIDSIEDQIKDIAQEGIDIFISNAGYANVTTTLLDTDRESWFDHFNINTVAPIQITKVLYKYLRKRSTKKIVFLSSIAASLTDPPIIPTGAYGLSKAGLNHYNRSLSVELKDEGFIIVSIHPGSVNTDMSNGRLDTIQGIPKERIEQIRSGLISTEECVSGILGKVVDKITIEDTGKFYNHDGSQRNF